MTEHVQVDVFMDQGVTDLPNNHFATHGIECDICMNEPDVERDKQTVRITACGHAFHTYCLGGWVTSSMQQHGISTCPMCRSVLTSRPPVADLDPDTSDLRTRMRDRLPVLLLDAAERLNARVDRTEAETYQLYSRVLRIARLMDAVDLFVDQEVVADLREFVAEYERAHRLRLVWHGVWARSRSLLRRTQPAQRP